MTDAATPTAAIKTLGCKLNQFESEQIRQQLCALGCRIVPFESPADIYVINSCTVTARTDRDCRRLIRHAKRLNPEAFVAVTGCYAEVSPEVLEAIPEADLVAGNRQKGDLVRLIARRVGDRLGLAAPELLSSQPTYGGRGEMIDDFSDHTRAFVKVQEGCDAHCTYCIIPRARGAGRSVPKPEVVQQVQRLIDAGHPEVVLIGIHLGKYGEDLPEPMSLSGLVAELCELPGLGRIRLSSIEPREVDEALIDLVAHHPRVCRHLHIPLQSGCDSVLARMGRPYDARYYRDLVDRVKQAAPLAGQGADVMVGFPGETEEEFAQTEQFVREAPLSYLHVFSYSPRPDTPAAVMPGQVAPEVKLARNHVLGDLSEAKRRAFANSMIGVILPAVIERPAPDPCGLLQGMCDNYLRVELAGPHALQGTIRTVRITGADREILRGELLD